MALSYSFHIGSDKNRKLSSRGLTTPSGSTSLSNNGIQNKAQLTRCDKHNYRLYDKDQEDIEIIKGTDSIVKDVKDLYHKEFDSLVLEYNMRQTRSDRKIDDYFEHVSQDKNRDLAVEIIVELGNKKFWDSKDDNYRRKMTNVYKQQIKDLELLLPEFKVCSAVVHYDETSPHMHIIGVPVKDGYKNGLSKQVCKSQVFNKNKLFELQENMRTLCINDFNNVYNSNEKLKTKEKGRNLDINVRDMEKYAEAKLVMDLESERLEELEKETEEFDSKNDNIKNMVDSIKQNPITKNYSLTQEEKEKIEEYIKDVDKQNQKNKNLNKIKNILDRGFDNMRELENVKDENKALNVKINALENKVKQKNKKISELEKLVDHFSKTADSFSAMYENAKGKFTKLIKHIAKRMTKPKYERPYRNFVIDLIKVGIFTKVDQREIDKAFKHIAEENERAAEEYYQLYKPKETKKDDDYYL